MEGQLLGGRYQLERQVGGGGMAIVYKARDVVLHRQVAVKLLRPQFGYDEDFVHRFRREAQSVASLSHPNVVSVYDVGQDGETHYMVMEYIEGPTLKDVINSRGALPVEEAVRIAVQVCDALEHAHQNKIIHRDIKPHNILIGRNNRVKVTDFGIARAVTQATITHTGSVLGSVHYFSPEQARGGITGEKSDIYSLGIVLYEMVTGRVPFSGESPISVALMHLQERLPEPRQINPDIPQSVENIILQALAKNPAFRYKNAAEMLEDLETCLFPERLNEPKLTIPTDDEETRVLPAITPEMLEQSKQERQERMSGASRSGEKEPQKKPKWWVKLSIWIGVLCLFVVLAFAGFNVLLNLIVVPEVPVPLVEGTMVELAKAKIQEQKLEPVVKEEYNDKAEKGVVFRQDPSPPMKLKEKSTVMLYVSLGKEPGKMPPLTGLNRASAEQALKAAGFTVTDSTFVEVENDNVRAGDVIDQSPLEGTEVIPSDTTVTVKISKGKQYVRMKDLRTLTVDQARVELQKLGLNMGKRNPKDTFTTKQPDIVLATYPYEAGMNVPVGETVDLDVSSGKYPDGAIEGKAPVFVDVIPGETAKVTITVSDARANDQAVTTETITESKSYDVPVIVSPTKQATIKVMKNDQEYQTFTVQYQAVAQTQGQ
ncbi:Stk1 family PASTA domain-containing Ser/Thr kinase [Brevibacillus fluminis]|uniref:Serine/threonine-protein kinase PrkC n=1 Tax=Brevibacillus fluminis TaxID=511487 RepID=A0A3M8DUM9_9BACL|nr:Stk1 family PASTA domain-containing Ser/Thr kinase [Brevibacillus fluminis]RNB91209.1 Stk1 family PASTA domain-containing Ser/Thr kinase [Brevibacillus fluminis]